MLRACPNISLLHAWVVRACRPEGPRCPSSLNEVLAKVHVVHLAEIKVAHAHLLLLLRLSLFLSLSLPLSLPLCPASELHRMRNVIC